MEETRKMGTNFGSNIILGMIFVGIYCWDFWDDLSSSLRSLPACACGSTSFEALVALLPMWLQRSASMIPVSLAILQELVNGKFSRKHPYLMIT